MVSENKKDGSRKEQATKERKHNNDIVNELLQINQFYYQFKKLTDQPQNAANTPDISATEFLLNQT